MASSVFVFGEPLAELADIRGDTARLGVGGDTFNTAVYIARSGVPVAYVSALGGDPLSRRVLGMMTEEGIGTESVLAVPGRPVGLYAIETDEVGERSFTYWRSASAFRAWFEADGHEEAFGRMAKADLLYLSGITLSAFSPANRDRVIGLADQVRRNGGRVAFDTNYRPAGWEDANTACETIRALMPSVSLALPTFEDEAALFGYDAPEACLDAWRSAGADEVCIKHGAAGALLSNHGWVAPTRLVRPVDTTGAGDSFNGAYLAGRLKGQDPLRAATGANELAGRVITVRGAIIPKEAVPTA